ncbi:MAG: hypothetical protein MJZ72_04260 [Bacteroidales bacterium]|nr:hypothetical protein [Bacteroidales bacterium]
MKALRFLGVAILACSMLFVSCKKDKQYTITVNSNNTAWGTVTGGGTYAENATATLTATAKEGYKFVQWIDGNTSNPRTITVTADATYTATFAENAGPGPHGEEGITVSFMGNTWEPGFVNYNEYLYYNSDICLYDLWIEEDNYLPSTDGILELDANAEQGFQLNYYKETGYTLETEDGEEVSTGDYAWLSSYYNDPITMSNVNFDATSMIASFTLNASLIDIYAYFAEETSVYENMTIVYNNVQLTEYTGAKGNHAKANKALKGNVVSIKKANIK